MLGIVTRMTLKMVPSYKLRATCTVMSLADFQARACTHTPCLRATLHPRAPSPFLFQPGPLSPNPPSPRRRSRSLTSPVTTSTHASSSTQPTSRRVCGSSLDLPSSFQTPTSCTPSHANPTLTLPPHVKPHHARSSLSGAPTARRPRQVHHLSDAKALASSSSRRRPTTSRAWRPARKRSSTIPTARLRRPPQTTTPAIPAPRCRRSCRTRPSASRTSSPAS